MLLRFYIGACYTHKYITNMKRMRATHIDIHDVHIHANLNTTRVCVVLLLHIPYRLRKMRLQLPSTNNCLAVVLRNRAQVPCIATTPFEQLPILQKPQTPFEQLPILKTPFEQLPILQKRCLHKHKHSTTLTTKSQLAEIIRLLTMPPWHYRLRVRVQHVPPWH